MPPSLPSLRPAPLRYPPGPRGRAEWTSAPDFGRNPVTYLQGLAQRYGTIARFHLGPWPLILLNDPELARHILVTEHRNYINIENEQLKWSQHLVGNGLLTSEGEYHLLQRRLLQPLFHRQKIAAYGATMSAYAGRAGARWQDGAQLDIAGEMMRLTLEIVAKAMFDAEVESETYAITHALGTIVELFNPLALPFYGLIEKLPLPMTRRFHSARDRIDATIYRMIAERRAAGVDRGDLLSMLLFARREDGSALTDEQVRDEAVTIFLAGHETTAVGLAWTWYLLAQHPRVLARLRVELDGVLGGRLPTLADIPHLAYTGQVFSEALRLYPPVWWLGRRAVAADEIGGYHVRAGTLVLVSPYVLHRDARYYPDPERFNPERFTPEAQAARPRFAYLPFGAGLRQCIGEPFAWMEGVLIIAALAQHWDMRVVPGHPVTLQPLITLRPRHGIRVVVSKRKRE